MFGRACGVQGQYEQSCFCACCSLCSSLSLPDNSAVSLRVQLGRHLLPEISDYSSLPKADLGTPFRCAVESWVYNVALSILYCDCLHIRDPASRLWKNYCVPVPKEVSGRQTLLNKRLSIKLFSLRGKAEYSSEAFDLSSRFQDQSTKIITVRYSL